IFPENVALGLFNFKDFNGPDTPQRQQSCMCGGTEPTPLCNDPCLVNDCGPPEAGYTLSDFDLACNQTGGEWGCKEVIDRQTGEVVARSWTTEAYDERGDGHYRSNYRPAQCTPPGPPPPNECQPIPQPPAKLKFIVLASNLADGIKSSLAAKVDSADASYT